MGDRLELVREGRRDGRKKRKKTEERVFDFLRFGLPVR
jgi:hypothetical protein